MNFTYLKFKFEKENHEQFNKFDKKNNYRKKIEETNLLIQQSTFYVIRVV